LPRLIPYSSRKSALIIGGLALLALLAVLVALSIGSVDIAAHEVLAALAGNRDTLAGRVVFELRLPRVLAGFLVGGMLALAGCLMQVLLRNPLAEPYVLGVSGGASVFALLVMMAGLTGYWVNLGAFAGALASILLVFGLARIGHYWNPMRVLLTGVVVAAGWSALISFLLTISPATQIYSMLYWLMGDLGYARFSGYALAVLLAALGASLVMARSLNLLTYGDEQAAALGVAVPRLRHAIYFLASLLTATAVMQAGSIGFIGLIIPHMVRLLVGGDHRLLIPASVLLGGCLLIIADSLARTIIAPQQLPVGVLTAIIGVPVFLAIFQFIVFKQKP
jgi:iron complex transport system permease protein